MPQAYYYTSGNRAAFKVAFSQFPWNLEKYQKLIWENLTYDTAFLENCYLVGLYHGGKQIQQAIHSARIHSLQANTIVDVFPTPPIAKV